MIWNRLKGLWNGYHCLLVVILCCVFWLYLGLLSLLLEDARYHYDSYIIYNIAAAVGLIAAALHGRADAQKLLSQGILIAHRFALRSCVYVGIAILILIVATKDAVISRVFLFSFIPLLYCVFLPCYWLLPKRLSRFFFPDESSQKTLMVGSLEQARVMEEWIVKTGSLGFGLRSRYQDEALKTESPDEELLHLPRLQDKRSLESLIKREGIGQILILELPPEHSQLNAVIEVANQVGVRLLIVNTVRERFLHQISYFTIQGRDFISLRDEPLQDPLNRILKRALDVTICLPIVLFVLPILSILVFIAQTIQSPGPLFFRQTRAGQGKRPFRIFKFRTMRVGPKKTADQATFHDERIFSVGRILRKTSLDEIPQFLNVLLGQMSVVGPRPHMIIHNRRFSEIMHEYHVRSYAKPGITGLAQIEGYRGEAKNHEDVVQRAKRDIRYIEHWSLAMDLWIIVKTAHQVIFPPRSAY